ncbi:hypothetical protein V1290_000008 [Bradyrhizobium sp. AZCC 1578]|uniref:hypothetical protein n=1 Tax=Bradyrhizobium sp. AZCC 1578 TaxID=3117027 RepID=UPI002FEFF0DE
MSDTDYDDHYDDGECWNCGGEGRVNHCIDGCCVDQDDPYCEYCSKRCDVCNPPTKEQQRRGDELRQILADALAESLHTRGGEE